MIELTKGNTPAWLEANQEKKTVEYKAAPNGNKPSPWRAGEIVTALKQECFMKCMYCECIIDDASYSAVEHIRPKSVFEDAVLEWDNLGLVCSRCNTNKGNYWTDSELLRLLNPYQDSLDEHIDFRGPLTVAKLDSSRGRNTMKRLKFNSRGDLALSRMMRIEDLEAKLLLWHEAVDPEFKSLYAEDIETAIANDREFSGVLRKYAIESGFLTV